MADNLNTQTLPKFDVETAVERLRTSKKEYEKEQAEAGVEEGADWATYHAEYGQLQKLDAIDFSDWWDSMQKENGKFAEWLDGLVDEHGTNSIFESYRERGQYPSDEYADGFVNGALAVFSAVASKL